MLSVSGHRRIHERCCATPRAPASSEELARLLFVWLVCWAIPASAENRHLSFDLVQSRLRRARLLDHLTPGAGAYPILLLIQGLRNGQVGVGITTRLWVIRWHSTAAAVPVVMAAAMLGLLAVNTLRGQREQADDNASEDGQA